MQKVLQLNKMELRKSRIEDAEGIGKVLKQSYNINSIEEGLSVFKDEINKGSNYIVAYDNGIIGLASWVVRGLPKHQLVELERIAVLPEYKGKGVAIKLFESLREDADNFYKSNGFKLRKVYLCVHATNLIAQSFYKKIGFSYEATLKNHYYNGVDEMIFSLFINKDS